LRAAVGEALCAQLLDRTLQDRSPEGWVSAETLNLCLQSHGYGPDAEFFQNDVAPHLCKLGQLIPYVPLLYWLVIRAIARLLCATGLHSIWQMLSELDDSGYGNVAVASLRTMRASSSALAGLPAGLWDFLECWQPWITGIDGQLRASQHFDYIAFFSDLRSSGIEILEEPSTQWFEQTMYVSPESAQVLQRRFNCTDVLTVVLQIKRALHLPLFGNKCPNTCVAYGWRVAGSTCSHVADSWSSGELGRTDVIYRTTCPAWDSSMPLTLPSTIGDGRFMSYPAGFRVLELHLQVYHIELPAAGGSSSSFSRGTLLGIASVPLAPLLTGFEELDGYFHISTMEEGSPFSPGSSGHGQIYVKLVPNSEALCQEKTMDAPVFPSDTTCHPTYDSRSRGLEPFVRRSEPIQESCSALTAAASLPSAPSSGLPSLHQANSGGTETNKVCWDADRYDVNAVALAIEQLPDFLDIFGSKPVPIPDGDHESTEHINRLTSSADAAKMSETELRMNSRLSSIELALSTSKDTEEQQLQTIRQCHQRNMAELEEMQHRLLCLSQEDVRVKAAPIEQPLRPPSEVHAAVSKQAVESCAPEDLPVESTAAAEAPLGAGTDKNAVAPPCAAAALAGDVAGGHVAGAKSAPMPTTSSASSSVTASIATLQAQTSGVRAIAAPPSNPGSVQSSSLPKFDGSNSLTSRSHAKATHATHSTAKAGFAEVPSFASGGVASKASQPHRLRADEALAHSDCAPSEDGPVSAGLNRVMSKVIETRDTASGTSPVHQVRADAAIQTEFVSSLTKLRESPGVLRLARRCQKGSPATASTTADITADLIETPRTDAGSEAISVATTAAPLSVEPPLQKIRGRPVKSDARYDAETERIARIMRGGGGGAAAARGSLAARVGHCGFGEDSDGSWSSEGE